jgi:hypothetical protein
MKKSIFRDVVIYFKLLHENASYLFHIFLEKYQNLDGQYFPSIYNQYLDNIEHKDLANHI